MKIFVFGLVVMVYVIAMAKEAESQHCRSPNGCGRCYNVEPEGLRGYGETTYPRQDPLSLTDDLNRLKDSLRFYKKSIIDEVNKKNRIITGGLRNRHKRLLKDIRYVTKKINENSSE